MSELLQAAQAAVLLGLRVIPPTGSIVRLLSVDERPDGSGTQLLATGRLVEVWRDFSDDVCVGIAGEYSDETSIHYVGEGNSIYPIKLPRGAPPLEEWELIDSWKKT